jgi:uncharacterized protein YbjT (DUF2867 family)
MVLVVGATGLLGAEICQQLRANEHPTRALVRDGSSREVRLRAAGVEIASGDLRDPRTVDVACRGVSTVITTANSMVSKRPGDSFETVDRDGSLGLVRAAQVAGVRQFIFTSVSPRLPANNPFVQYKRDVEAAVRASHLTWTILQPSAFMEIHAGPAAGWDFAAGRARIMGSGRVPVAYISVADVAAFAVAAVENPAAADRALHIAGPEPLTGLDAVAIAERVTGRVFSVQRLPTVTMKLLRVALRPVNPRLSAVMGLGIGMQEGDGVAMEPLLREFVLQATTFEQYVRRSLEGVIGPPVVA